LSRVRSQYFFNFCPTLFRGADRAKKSCAQSHLRGDAARLTQHPLLLQGVDVVVETDFGGGVIDEMPVDTAAGFQRLERRAGVRALPAPGLERAIIRVTAGSQHADERTIRRRSAT
jgi:hypothetical protein